MIAPVGSPRCLGIEVRVVEVEEGFEGGLEDTFVAKIAASPVSFQVGVLGLD